MVQALAQILLCFVAACLFALGANWLALGPWRRSVSAHWTERARILWPVRVSAATNIFLIPAVLLLADQLVLAETAVWWLPVAFGAWMGAVLGSFPLDRAISRRWTFISWAHYVFGSWIIRFAIWFVIVGGAVAMPAEFDWRTGLVVAVVLTVHLGFLWGIGLKLLRLTRLLQPPGERLQRIVAETSRRMNIPVRKVWLLAGAAAQAFALPMTRELLFSSALLEISTDEELSAICAHELAHLNESKAALARRIFNSMTLLPLLFINPMVHLLGYFGFVLLMLAIVLMSLFARGFSLRMEKRADEVATANQAEAGVYARALEKLYRANHLPAVNPDNRRTHPHLYDRLLAAGLTPEYPRPRPPEKLAWNCWILLLALGILVGIYITRLGNNGTQP